MGHIKLKRSLKWEQDSFQTRQFSDTPSRDNSQTGLKTVSRNFMRQFPDIFVQGQMMIFISQICLMKQSYLSYHISITKNYQNSLLNPFPNKPWFLPVCSTSPWKTLREKEKLLIMSNFSISHSVFSSCVENFLPFTSNSKLLSANCLSLEKSKMCRLGKG